MTRDKPKPDLGVIDKDGYDTFAYQGALSALPDLGALDERYAERNESAPALLEDVYAALYKSRPKLREDETAPEAPVAHRQLMEQLMESIDYDRMRATTKMSRAGAAIGTLELGESLLDQIPQREPKQDDADDQGWEYLDGCDDADGQGRRLRTMVRRARQRAEETLETMRAFGWGDGPGQESVSDLQNAANLSRRLRSSDKLRKIAALAGRMKRLAMAKRKVRARRQPDEVVGVEVGRDIARALPSELAMLGTVMRDQVLLRWAQGQLLQFRVEGTEQLSEGPIVVAIDSSASMSGDRDTWAKALALGLLAIAHREKREFAVMLFGSRDQLQCWEFGKDAPMQKVLECMSTFFNGGTDFRTPLDRALRIVEGSAENATFKRADVVFITDGECRITPDFVLEYKERAERTGAHLYSIYVGTRGRSLDVISDGVAYVPHLGDGADAEALELAFGI